MSKIDIIKEKARKNKKKIVFPESWDPRILQAAEQIVAEKLAEVVVLGEKEKVDQLAQKEGLDLSGIELINPETSDWGDQFTEEFYTLRKHKGLEKNEARKTIKNPIYFGTMMIHMDKVQGMVAGADTATGKVLLPAFQIVKTQKNVSVASGAFIMDLPDNNPLGERDTYVFADCAVNPQPDPKELAEIAICSAQTARKLLEVEPKVAFLSFSSKGSADHELVSRVRKAVDLAREKNPDFLLDGELQVDAALIPEIAKKKAPESELRGQANVLIFPDLQAGNIGYKIVERMAGAQALGPILQGLARPINDLSRGCSVQDIVDITAITSMQAE
ncbi:MAG: phosphate acetyltransferase [Halanaerobiaceae bacterium]